jgi:hypothetical protein
MIEHESDLWPERRWAIQEIQKVGVRWEATVYYFRSAKERDAWVAGNVLTRVAVGKRHPLVKALRQQWRQEALSKLGEWRARHQ